MEAPRDWRLKKQRYQMVGEECPHCEEKIFPPRDICPRCGAGTLKNNSEAKVVKNKNKKPEIVKPTDTVIENYYAEKGLPVDNRVVNTRINIHELVNGTISLERQ